jgi:hypothetical protein
MLQTIPVSKVYEPQIKIERKKGPDPPPEIIESK